MQNHVRKAKTQTAAMAPKNLPSQISVVSATVNACAIAKPIVKYFSFEKQIALEVTL
jgi:hypothetical protein